jgi:hypothetical protein
MTRIIGRKATSNRKNFLAAMQACITKNKPCVAGTIKAIDDNTGEVWLEGPVDGY